jgi:hypothetical protein
LIEDLAADRALARDLGQPSAAIAATQLTAKLVGLLVDRKEQGQPGEFAGLQSAEEVLALIKRELGDETAAALTAALAQQDSAQDQAAEPEPEQPLIDTSRAPGDALN